LPDQFEQAGVLNQVKDFLTTMKLSEYLLSGGGWLDGEKSAGALYSHLQEVTGHR
jgi:hypothetical protein